MTDISNNHPYHFSVPAPKDSPYAKYDISKPLYGSTSSILKMIARTPAEQARVADGRVDVNDVDGLFSMGRKDEVNGLIEQLKADGKLTEAEKVARIKEDFAKDQDLYLKNYTEWRDSPDIKGRDFIDALPRVFLKGLEDIITHGDKKTSSPKSKELSYGQRIRTILSLLTTMNEEELFLVKEYMKRIEEARGKLEN
ncbi:MAG: hypothetical protein LBD62_02960 [Candidatus Margulisbacteria bacterium]|jgi:hypothetical protein|nr:hypothetical protein [Candidatus Margulisiibacteriota bacterium]